MLLLFLFLFSFFHLLSSGTQEEKTDADYFPEKADEINNRKEKIRYINSLSCLVSSFSPRHAGPKFHLPCNPHPVTIFYQCVS